MIKVTLEISGNTFESTFSDGTDDDTMVASILVNNGFEISFNWRGQKYFNEARAREYYPISVPTKGGFPKKARISFERGID